MSVICSVCLKRGHNRKRHGVSPVASGGGKSPGYKSAWGKVARLRAATLGRCIDCGDEAADGAVRCRACADEQNVRQRELRGRRERYREALEQIRAICAATGAPAMIPRIVALADNALGNAVSRGTTMTILTIATDKGA